MPVLRLWHGDAQPAGWMESPASPPASAERTTMLRAHSGTQVPTRGTFGICGTRLKFKGYSDNVNGAARQRAQEPGRTDRRAKIAHRQIRALPPVM